MSMAEAEEIKRLWLAVRGLQSQIDYLTAHLFPPSPVAAPPRPPIERQGNVIRFPCARQEADRA